MRTFTFSYRLTLSVVAGAALAFFAVVLPVLGTHAPDADRLHMTSDGDAFIYEYHTTPVVQAVNTSSNTCVVNPAGGTLVNLSSSARSGGGIKGPGIFDHGIGVKSGGSNGTPCSETSGNEQLVIASNGNSWFKLRLNAEAKSNAWIVVELVNGTDVETHQLLTGGSIETYNIDNGTALEPTMTFPYTATTVGDGDIQACADPNDSGPDSGPNDNCLWTLEAGSAFDEVRIYTLEGAVSLEGGHDFEAFDSAGADSGEYDSLFFRAHAPVAGDDGYTTDEDTTLNVSSPGVLANDTGDPGLTLSAEVVSQPSKGTLTLNADGSFGYVPNANANGTDAFTYQATAGGVASDPATVTISVNPVNDTPVAVDVDDAYSTNEDTVLTVAVPGVLANDSDVDGDSLTAAFDSGPSNGTLTLDTEGSFTYTPAENFFGSDSFTYRANDGTVDSNVATVTITINSVNDAPEALGDALNAAEDAPTTFSGSDLATDVDGDPLSITAAEADNEEATISFNLDLNGEPDGTITYVPAPDSCEPDALISFTVEDGNGGVLTGSVAIIVECANDAPVAVDDTYETDERDNSGPVTLTVPLPGVLGNDTDIEGDPLAASPASPTTAAGGSVTLNTSGGFSYTPGSYTWAPDEFSYVDTWDYTVSDGNLGTDVGTVEITVHRVICSAETVTDIDGDYSGSFTLLTLDVGCKRYEVDADAQAMSVTFTPDPREGQPEAFFRGELTFAPQVLSDGTFSLGLNYDPDNEGPQPAKPVLVCLDPVFDAGGKITSATLPGPPGAETWCLASALSQASGSAGELTTLFQVYGTEDPEFSFR